MDPMKSHSSAGALMKSTLWLLALLIPALGAHAEAKTIPVPMDVAGQHALLEKSGSSDLRVV
ncbi:hypothetical protein ALP71_03869, partial [Pseudomonas coronafaciens pv. garcae]